MTPTTAARPGEKRNARIEGRSTARPTVSTKVPNAMGRDPSTPLESTEEEVARAAKKPSFATTTPGRRSGGSEPHTQPAQDLAGFELSDRELPVSVHS